jgi:hypothetical protein
MPNTPAVRASTETRSKKNEVFDKTTSDSNDRLKQAIAAVMQSTSEGRSMLDNISTKLQKQERDQHTRDMKKKK